MASCRPLLVGLPSNSLHLYPFPFHGIWIKFFCTHHSSTSPLGGSSRLSFQDLGAWFGDIHPYVLDADGGGCWGSSHGLSEQSGDRERADSLACSFFCLGGAFKAFERISQLHEANLLRYALYGNALTTCDISAGYFSRSPRRPVHSRKPWIPPVRILYQTYRHPGSLIQSSITCASYRHWVWLFVTPSLGLICLPGLCRLWPSQCHHQLRMLWIRTHSHCVLHFTLGLYLYGGLAKRLFGYTITVDPDEIGVGSQKFAQALG